MNTPNRVLLSFFGSFCILLFGTQTVLQAVPTVVLPAEEQHIPAFIDNPVQGLHTTSAADAITLEFSKLMSNLAAHALRRGHSSDHANFARIYFNGLYFSGDREIKKTLGHLSYKLGELIDSTYFAGTRKDVDASQLLSKTFEHIDSLTNNPVQRTQAMELYKSLQVAITPAMRGIKERLAAMPWGKIGLATAAVGGIAYARHKNLVERTSGVLEATRELMDHITDSAREAQRQSLAFYETIQTDPKGGFLLSSKEIKAEKKVYFTKWDSANKRYLYLQIPSTGIPFSIDQIYTNPDPTSKDRSFTPAFKAYRDKKVKNDDGKYILKNWVEAPEAITERAVSALEGLLPLTNQLTKQIRTGIDQQSEWYEGHKIMTHQRTGRRRMVRVFVPTDGESLSNPHNWEMRYVSEVGNSNDSETVKDYAQQFKRFGRDKTIIPRLWRNDIANEKDPQHKNAGKYHETFLPERNVLEQLINTLNKVNRSDSTAGGLLEVLTAQLNRSDIEVQDWLKNIGNIDNGTVRFEKGVDGKQGTRYYIGLQSNDKPLSQDEYNDLPRTRAADGRETQELAHYDNYFEKENIPSAPARAAKLYKHYPDSSILEKLTGTIHSFDRKESTAGGLVRTLTDVIGRSYTDDAHWRYEHGFTTDPLNASTYKKREDGAVASRRLDEKGLPFWAFFHKDNKEAGTSADRVYEDRGINGLWSALDSLSADKDSTMTGLAGSVNKAMSGDPKDLEHIVKAILGTPNADVFVRKLLGDIHVPYVTLPSKYSPQTSSAEDIEKTIKKVEKDMRKAILERDRIKKHTTKWHERYSKDPETSTLQKGADQRAKILNKHIKSLEQKTVELKFKQHQIHTAATKIQALARGRAARKAHAAAP